MSTRMDDQESNSCSWAGEQTKLGNILLFVFSSPQRENRATHEGNIGLKIGPKIGKS